MAYSYKLRVAGSSGAVTEPISGMFTTRNALTVVWSNASSGNPGIARISHGYVVAGGTVSDLGDATPSMRKLAMKAAVGVAVSKKMKVMRFGDNMREVAVTEGDKVEAQIKLGWQVNTWPVGKLVEVMNAVTEDEVNAMMKEYESLYDIATDNIENILFMLLSPFIRYRF